MIVFEKSQPLLIPKMNDHEPSDTAVLEVDDGEEYTDESEPFLPSVQNLLSNDLGLRIQDQDESALAEVMQLSGQLLRCIIFRILKSEADTTDALANIYLEIWRRADKFDPAKGQFTGWVITIARRRAIDFLRKREAYDPMKGRYHAKRMDKYPKSPRRFEEVFIDDDRNRALVELLDSAKIPEAQQQVLKLAYFKGMSQRQIAAFTGTPLGTIKTRLELAMRKLRGIALSDPRIRGE